MSLDTKNGNGERKKLNWNENFALRRVHVCHLLSRCSPSRLQRANACRTQKFSKQVQLLGHGLPRCQQIYSRTILMLSFIFNAGLWKILFIFKDENPLCVQQMPLYLPCKCSSDVITGFYIAYAESRLVGGT